MYNVDKKKKLRDESKGSVMNRNIELSYLVVG